jgi:hypothetical protein
VDNYDLYRPSFVTPKHGRSKNGIAELVIGPATFGRTLWLAYASGLDAAVSAHGLPGQSRQ